MRDEDFAVEVPRYFFGEPAIVYGGVEVGEDHPSDGSLASHARRAGGREVSGDGGVVGGGALDQKRLRPAGEVYDG